MKNLFLLPTDKPSRLIKSQDNDFVYLNINAPNWFEINLKTTKQNIYITNSKEIKEGDWFYEPINESILKYDSKSNKLIKAVFSGFCNKIILTTDQDLIKDGVQKIDDDFLEWFVKNPSCEFVEVINDTYTVGEMSKLPLGTRNHKYKLIIPKEEPKIKSFENAKSFFINKIDKAIENSKQELKQECECTDECLGYLTKDCKGIEQPKQETLEEVINNEINNIHINSSNLENIAKYNRISGTLFSELKKCMINIAKWQQEQDKNKYSEEEVLKLWNWLNDGFMMRRSLPTREELIGWFEQFKKK